MIRTQAFSLPGLCSGGSGRLRKLLEGMLGVSWVLGIWVSVEQFSWNQRDPDSFLLSQANAEEKVQYCMGGRGGKRAGSANWPLRPLPEGCLNCKGSSLLHQTFSVSPRQARFFLFHKPLPCPIAVTSWQVPKDKI